MLTSEDPRFRGDDDDFHLRGDDPVGAMRGGLGIVNVFSSMLFGGISGSAVADISALGSILIPSMKEKGYDD